MSEVHPYSDDPEARDRQKGSSASIPARPVPDLSDAENPSGSATPSEATERENDPLARLFSSGEVHAGEGHAPEAATVREPKPSHTSAGAETPASGRDVRQPPANTPSQVHATYSEQPTADKTDPSVSPVQPPESPIRSERHQEAMYSSQGSANTPVVSAPITASTLADQPTLPTPTSPTPTSPTPTSPTLAVTAQAEAAPRQVISLATVSGASQANGAPAQAASDQEYPLALPPMIRCRQCGKSASSELVLCPHCGRELRAAPSRWLTIGLPAVLAVLLLALLALQGGSGPLGIVGAPVRALSNLVTELSSNLDPQLTVIPAAGNTGAVALSESAASSAMAMGSAPIESAEEVFDEVSDVSLIGGESDATLDPVLSGAAIVTGTLMVTPAMTAGPLVPEFAVSAPATADNAAAERAAAEPVALPTLTIAPSDTPTSLPTDTPQPTPTPLPTDTPAPTNTPLPATYTVVSGDTALGIAMRLGVGLDELIAYNNMTAQQAAMLQPGQVLRIPGGVVTADTAAGETSYLVREGDTLVVIAQRNGVSVAELMAANGLSQSDAFTLRPGQTLIIPGPTPAPTATTAPAQATETPAVAAAAPTATRAAATPTSPAASASLRVTAPRLRAPISGVSLRCSVEGRLQWNASPDIEPDDNYRVHLGFVNGRDTAGNLQITWLVEQAVPSTQTQVALDSTLCGTAPDGFGSQWRWYVDVVADANGTKVPVSTPSEVWGFAWE